MMNILENQVWTGEEIYQMAVSAHRSGDLNTAATLYQLMLEKYPQHAEILSLFGELAFDAKNYKLAVELLRRAIAAAPEETIYYLSLARMLTKIGDLNGAIIVYEECIARKLLIQTLSYGDTVK
ncbi:tetratricopeptide repeat protein [Pelosinus sp. sgz500959]|uniref:tetratricopeptide repeat protein n=1 Tax=Pelosinus sp. sgz500959 TaxID=3242472 RepID=UPI00366AFFCB